jgi:hypothetical protein
MCVGQSEAGGERTATFTTLATAIGSSPPGCATTYLSGFLTHPTPFDLLMPRSWRTARER